MSENMDTHENTCMQRDENKNQEAYNLMVLPNLIYKKIKGSDPSFHTYCKL